MLFELLEKGGVIVAPLLICSVVGLGIIFERLWTIRRGRVLPKNLDAQVAELIRAGKHEEAMATCRRDDSPLARLLFSALRARGKSRDDFNDLVELTGKRELSMLQRYIGVLGTIAAIAPLLGLLGTVIGIIKTFAVIETHGIGNPQLLAGGISEALIATASGICIAVPCVIFYRFFLQRTKALALELEEAVQLTLLEGSK